MPGTRQKLRLVFWPFRSRSKQCDKDHCFLVLILIHDCNVFMVESVHVYIPRDNFKRFISGPMFHPEMHGSLAFFRAILNGERLKEIPNDSMSFIDVRDLAELELAALENKNARGK